MPTAQTERFRRAIDRAFAMASRWERVTSGPFAFRVGVDAVAGDLDFFSAFPKLPLTHEAEFEAAIIGGHDPLLAELLPNIELGHLHTDGDIYALWVGAPHFALFVYDFAARRGFMWLAQGTAQYWLRCRPILPILHAYATDTPWCPAHMAAVGKQGRFLLLSGGSGAGKSTAALACLLAGWDLAGDDVVMVNATTAEVAGLYVSARLRKQGIEPLARLVELAAIAESDENDDPRYELRVGHLAGTATIGPVAAIILPKRRGGEPFRFTPARPFEVFSATMPYTSILAQGMHETLMKKLFGVARMAPAFTTDTGTDPLQIPAAFEAFLESRL